MTNRNIDILNGTRPIIRTSEKYMGILQDTATQIDGIWYVDHSGHNYNNGKADLSFEEYQRKVDSCATLLSWEQWEKLHNIYLRSQLTRPLSIPQEALMEAFRILPPCRWHNVQGFTLFYVSKHALGGLVTWYAQRDDFCWKWVEFACTPSSLLIDQLLVAIKKQENADR